jgi:hypothetical protein
MKPLQVCVAEQKSQQELEQNACFDLLVDYYVTIGLFFEEDEVDEYDRVLALDIRID